MNKAVFLDRDKTIIEDDEGYISNPAKVKLLPNVGSAIKKLNDNGFMVIIISNQSGIGRGMFNKQDLQSIHQKMTDLLQKENAFIDDIFYCPHHPEAKVDEFRKNCTCRKPLPGMIIKAAMNHKIDLNQSYCVGDEERDIEAGKNAGCRTIRITKQADVESKADYKATDLKKAVEIILEAKSRREN
ncbi:hypothetical protein LCGC14_2669170 [marine sediment metagenome]|uniref:D,D-heptose 1,7-bisphosphate phosphatase n=1 Tax=marine sediment metagenome TaxID=412755 RepID=A0A0F9AC04_9ZZZZ